jgi:hypothetical protein
MADDIQYALLAGSAYTSNRNEVNRIPVPQGWSVLPGREEEKGSGLEISVFNGKVE